MRAHVICVSFTKALPLGYLVPSLKSGVFQGKVYLWRIVFLFYENSSLCLLHEKKKYYTVSMCTNFIFNLPGISSLQFPTFSAIFSMRHDVEGHTPVPRASPPYHFPHHKVLLLHSFETNMGKDYFGLQYFQAQLFSSENARRKTSTTSCTN